MEQRSLRLGDLIDDYCPRERRVTNHAIVALVGDTIRQTRCTTCESEHPYKEARVPRKKPRNGEAHDLAGGVLVVPKPAAANGPAEEPEPEPVAAVAAQPAEPEPAPDVPAAAQDEEPAGDDETLPDGWLAHRPLIRATLPKTEGDTPAPRPIPEFTMHQRQGRGFGRGFNRGSGYAGGRVPPPHRDGHEPDGNRAAPPPGKSRHRRRHRRPR
jgi:hypothetical protein